VPLEGVEQAGEVVAWDVVGRRPAEELAQQGGHRWAFIDEDPQVALGGSERERVGEAGQCGWFVVTSGMGERPQRLNFDDTAGPSLVGGQGVPASQERERLLGCLGGEQHPGQDQVLALAWVAGFVPGAQPGLPAASGSRISASTRPRPALPGPGAQRRSSARPRRGGRRPRPASAPAPPARWRPGWHPGRPTARTARRRPPRTPARPRPPAARPPQAAHRHAQRGIPTLVPPSGDATAPACP
jgi:hypothetical protein